MKAWGFLGGPLHQLADRRGNACGNVVSAEAQARRLEERNDSLGQVLDIYIVADRIDRADTNAFNAFDRQMSNAIRNMANITAWRHAIHGSIDRRGSNRGGRDPEHLSIALDNQLGGELGDPVKLSRHYVPVFGQRLSRAIRPAIQIDRARADIDEAL